MKNSMNIGMLGGIAVAATLVVSCGGGGGDDAPAAVATTIDTASVTKAVASVSTMVPICSSPAAALLATVEGGPAVRRTLWLAKGFALSQSPRRSINALINPPPTDTLGDCGGRLTYPAYSHTSGVTTATLAFENFCRVNVGSNTREILNGNVAFVDTGTPSASGPVRSKIEANSPAGVTITTKDSTTDQTLDSTLVTLSSFLYTVGDPGLPPSAAKPDRFTLGELKATTAATAQTPAKTYRATGFSAEMFTTASGGLQFTGSGRGYRSNGEYYDVTTSVPLVLDATGNPTAGAVTFTGANNSNAVATLVPGAVLKVMMTVNGTPLAGMPTCN